jgi:hypothetical protein
MGVGVKSVLRVAYCMMVPLVQSPRRIESAEWVAENLVSNRMRHQRCVWHGKRDVQLPNPNAPGVGANVTVYATRSLKDIRTIMNAALSIKVKQTPQ